MLSEKTEGGAQIFILAEGVIAASTQRPHGEPGLLPRLSSNEASLPIPRRVALEESYSEPGLPLLLLISNVATSTKSSKDHMGSISEVLLLSRGLSLPPSGNKDPLSSYIKGH